MSVADFLAARPPAAGPYAVERREPEGAAWTAAGGSADLGAAGDEAAALGWSGAVGSLARVLDGRGRTVHLWVRTARGLAAVGPVRREMGSQAPASWDAAWEGRAGAAVLCELAHAAGVDRRRLRLAACEIAALGLAAMEGARGEAPLRAALAAAAAFQRGDATPAELAAAADEADLAARGLFDPVDPVENWREGEGAPGAGADAPEVTDRDAADAAARVASATWRVVVDAARGGAASLADAMRLVEMVLVDRIDDGEGPWEPRLAAVVRAHVPLPVLLLAMQSEPAPPEVPL